MFRRRIASGSAPNGREISSANGFRPTGWPGGMLRSFIKLVLVPYCAFVVGVVLLQRKVLYPKPAVVASALAGGTLVRIPSASKRKEDETVAVYFPSVARNGPVLVFFHGNGDQVGWGAVWIAQHLLKKGCGIFAVEYPGYGFAAAGTTNEANIYGAAETAIKHLTASAQSGGLGVPEDKVILFGQSIGSGAATEMAVRGFGKRLVLLSPFTSVPDMAAHLLPKFLLPPFLIRDKFDNLGKAKRVRLPTLVIHGTDDEIVPASMGAALGKAIPGARLHLVQNTGHNNILDGAKGRAVLDEIAAFALAP
eukprot:TRINITY_DN27893_c0_g1_i1.p1 TRINITY_DN27893_c0_g1~~TRINITY_DN27893_c0_g1_i1.p1  ORF type:complete len:316 (+),score=41.58 TRINITY_DN27893_c0_g1_i1:26-949(+)